MAEPSADVQGSGEPAQVLNIDLQELYQKLYQQAPRQNQGITVDEIMALTGWGSNRTYRILKRAVAHGYCTIGFRRALCLRGHNIKIPEYIFHADRIL